jgi:hypothetical protein
MVSRITGGAPAGKSLVNPTPKVKKGRTVASVPGEKEMVTSENLLPAEEVAKKKLIHELSELKIE